MDVLRDDYDFAHLEAEFVHILQLKASTLVSLLDVINYGNSLPGHVKFSKDKLEKIRQALARKLEHGDDTEDQHSTQPGNDPCSKYYATKETAKSVLEKYGVAIIPSVLDEAECQAIVDGMWEFLETITAKFDVPIKRADQATWSSYYDLFTLHSMLMQHWKVGHAQFVWNVRQNRKVASIFAHLWRVPEEELIVSFDGVSFHMPPEVTKRGHYRGNDWFHTDQSLRNSDFQCAQGWVTGLDVRQGDATLTFLEESHNLHEELADTITTPKAEDWYKLSAEEIKWYEEGQAQDSTRGKLDMETAGNQKWIRRPCPRRDITCPKGSVVLWDSRTIHAGKEALKERAQMNFRCVVYVCYVPHSFISETNRKKKLRYLEEMRMTSHWPDKIKVFPVNPRTYGKELPTICDIDPPQLSEFGRLLAGELK